MGEAEGQSGVYEVCGVDTEKKQQILLQFSNSVPAQSGAVHVQAKFPTVSI